MTPELDVARSELSRLRAERARAGRVFYTVVPFAMGAIVVGVSLGPVAHPLPLMVLGGGLLAWGLLTGIRVIPAPVAPRRYYPNHERIHYLEGVVDAATPPRSD